MLKKIIKLFLVLTFIGSGYCLSQPVNTRNILIRETDGSPSGYLRQLYVTNTTLTKNSSGNFTLDSGSGGAGGNSFSTWAVNSTDIIAGNSSSTMTLTPGDNVTFIANNTTKTITINATGGGGAETNSLETTITGIADTEIFVGNDSDNGNFVTMSGDATLANTGALTIVDDSHNHVIGNIDAFTVADLQTQTSDVSIFVNNGTAFGGEVSGTYGAIVLGHDALDDQYYDSESDLTTLLDNNYVDEGQVNSIDSDMYVDGSVDDVHLATDFISETELSNITELDTQIGITGTANTTTFLRGDGAWEIPAGGAATNSITTWAVNGTTMTVDSTSDTWNITAGANVTITGDNGTKVVTIDSSAGGGGGSARKGYHRLPIQQARVTGGFTTGNASISAINSTFALLLDNVTDESSVWSWDVPSDYTGNLTAHLSYSMVDATSGTVGLEIEVMAITDGDSTDVNTASFDTANIVADGTTVPGTAGYPDLVNITLTNADSLAANDRTIIRVMRNVDANDTAVGDCALDGFKLEYD